MEYKFSQIKNLIPNSIIDDKKLSIIIGHDGSDWNSVCIDSYGNIKNRNLIWNTSTLAWEAATGSLTSGNNVTVNNFPATQAISAVSLPLPSGAATNNTLIEIRNYLDTAEDKLQSLIEQTNELENNTSVTVANLQALNSLIPSVYDYTQLSYSGEDVSQIVYKIGGAGGTVVSTLDFAYSGGNLISIIKS